MINAMRYTKLLEDGGYSKEQASAQAKVWEQMSNEHFSTKHDIQIAELALRSDMKEMESSIRSDMKEMESSLRSDMHHMESAIRSDMKEMEYALRSEMQELKNLVISTHDKTLIKLSGVMAIMMSAVIAAQKIL